MSITSIQNTAKKGIIGVNKCVDLTYNDPYAAFMHVVMMSWEF